MHRSRLLLGVAAVLAGTTVLMAVLGVAYNPLLLGAALPFGAAAYFLWSHATGRLGERMRVRARRREPGTTRGRASRDRPGPERPEAGPSPAVREAARTLGVAPDADEARIRRAFRERARELHPDAPGGDEATFRRLREAYERLRDAR